MAEVREVFASLEDAAGAGLALRRVVEGDAHTGKSASAALSFVDPTGNLVYARTNAQKELIVSTESAQVATLSDSGQNAGSQTVQVLVTIPLLNDYVYRKIDYHGSCTRETYFEVVWIDDVGGTPTETVLRRFRTGAGDYNDGANMGSIEFTSGSTGTQELQLRGQNLFGVNSTFDGDLAVVELQP